MSKLKLPQIQKVELRSFSLYSSKPRINVSLPNGVFCLAGANGLGKSTFLAAINYAITGRVADPTRDFKSVEEYYSHTGQFVSEFFSGRINDNDREAAAISLEMRVGDRLYHITRGIFEINQLRIFEIRAIDQSQKLLQDFAELSPTERHTKYTEQIISDIGLHSFDQLVFLQHFVLTFDERRFLLFWNPPVLEQALYLAFGVDHADARRADTLRRERDKAASLARNANWQATEVRKKIDELESKAAQNSRIDPKENDVVAEHRELLDQAESQKTKVERVESELKDVDLNVAALSAEQFSLRNQYTEEFSTYINGRSHLLYHPLIAASIEDANCGLCGASGKRVADAVRLSVSTDKCPLCGSPIPTKRNDLGDSRSAKKLQALDKKLGEIKDKIDAASKARARIAGALENAQRDLQSCEARLDKFAQANQKSLERLKHLDTGSAGISTILEQYQSQMEDFERRKKEEYNKRDEKQRELKKFQQRLEIQYREAEELFVPLFNELAFKFLGIELEIRLETKTASGVNLILDVKGTTRRQHHQLSESQRFFIDIALRMALAQHMSDPENGSCLFIDTPEGSLDIAYESRAGDMFAHFIESGYRIVMTANINSSRMLRSLAEKCGRAKMTLHRMTSWAELSEVQVEENKLFEGAFREIERALVQSPAKAK